MLLYIGQYLLELSCKKTFLYIHNAHAHGVVTRFVYRVKHLIFRTHLHMWYKIIITVNKLVAVERMWIETGLVTWASEVVVTNDVSESVTGADPGIVQCVTRTWFPDRGFVKVFTEVVIGTVVGIRLYHIT